MLVIRKITWLSLRKVSLFDQIKQEVKSEAFKKHWILPQCKRNSSKEMKTPLKIPALFRFFAHYFQHYLAKFSALFSIFFAHSTRCPAKRGSKKTIDFYE